MIDETCHPDCVTEYVPKLHKEKEKFASFSSIDILQLLVC